MKTLVIYDSNFGNTKLIAEKIAEELETQAISVANITKKTLGKLNALVVGSPIQGWKPSEKMNKFLDSLKSGQLKHVKVAAFDTRVNLFFHGDATHKIEKELEHAGAEIVTKPKPFFVKGTKGPLLYGETQKAKEWGQFLRKYLQ